MSAWIEIIRSSANYRSVQVALYMGAWIEMVNGGKRQESLVLYST